MAEEYMAEGCGEEEAVGKAIARMGDPVLVGKQLHQVHKPRIEWGILGIVAVFSIIGLVTLVFVGIE